MLKSQLILPTIEKPHLIWYIEALKHLSEELGVKITGSELIGLIPEEALRMAGEYYASSSDPEENMLAAAEILDLNSVKDFRY